MVFGSRSKISKTFFGEKIIFFPGGKNIIYFRDVNVSKIWSKMLYVWGKYKFELKNLSYRN